MRQAVRVLLQRKPFPVVNGDDGHRLDVGLATDEQAVEGVKGPLIVRLRTEHEWEPLQQINLVGGYQAALGLRRAFF